ncbi:response regulator transcription factor [Mangrovicoccus algicola]|uniref:Response regulator transcription factor n=1 Tax=Mangrovicoccus algicola TaxID=2771008 RepID=A0A8J6Z2E6_9RHOB|nr:response regulator transcription factor [Mangrovicoccus algicola]MBE3640401.1 response regulator transcription factor [Mangrovicoccus algicola]
MRVLMVEDAADLAEAVAARLGRSGVACDLAGGVAEAADFLAVQGYDAIILDVNLPDGSGTDLLRGLRARGERVPVLMLTANVAVEDRVGALDLGADDYLVKPFDQRELEARLRAVVRREAERKSGELVLGPLRFSPATLDAELDGARLALTRREAVLLGALMRHPGQVHSKERLYGQLFTFEDADVGLNAIELYVARLRKRLAGSAVAITTQRGLGYRIGLDG